MNTGAWWSSDNSAARLPATTGLLPHARDLSDLQLMLAALAVIGAGWAVRSLWQRVPRTGRIVAAALAFTLAAMAAPGARMALLAPVAPHFEDVAVVGRALAAFVSTLSILLVYAIGARLYAVAVGVAAAAFFAVTVRAVQLAHFFAVEPLQTFAVLLAVWISARILEQHRLAPAADRLSTPLLFAALGAAIGMAMASKFSAAPLFAVPVVLYVILLRTRGGVPAFALHSALAICYLAALATWFQLHPYAWELPYEPYEEASSRAALSDRWLHILFSQDFAAQIAEQGRMVRGEGGGPWVQQFADTVPFITMLAQMVRWSFGWPLGVAVLTGTLYVCVRNVQRPAAADVLLLSVALPLLAIVGSFEASFPRYTLPVLGILCIFAARLCIELGNRLKRRLVAIALVLVATTAGAIYCVAYLHVYEAPHAWTTASSWIYKNIASHRADGRRTTIAHEEWDDDIPIAVGMRSPAEYAGVRLDPYSDDSSEKAARLARQLASADWICLATPRAYSTVLKVAEDYPLTARYYRLLFAGELGFTLRKTVYQPPRLWSLSFPDLSADESHYVYDHPKAVIFEKTTPLSAPELERRILDRTGEPAIVTRDDILHAREIPFEQLQHAWRDAYAGENVFTAQEVAIRLRQLGVDDHGTITRVLDALRMESPRRAVTLSDVKAATAVTPLDATAMRTVSDRLQNLSTVDAYPGTTVARLVRAALPAADNDRVRDMARSIEWDPTSAHVDREAMLRRLERIEWTPPIGAGRLHNPERSDVRFAVTAETNGWVDLWHSFKWLLALQIVGLATLPFTAWLFSRLPDRGYGLARIVGWVITTYLASTLAAAGAARFSAGTCWLAILATTAVCWGIAGRRVARRLPPVRTLLAAEIVFLGSFAGFALLRAFNPEIYWGEKTMDLALLNAVMRGGLVPPYEPWFAGVSLNYYYHGYFLVGLLSHLAAVPTAIAFNLAIATIAALTLAAAFSIGSALTRSLPWALVTAASVGLVSNLDHLFQWIRAERHASVWDSFWASSRALGPGMINEYPVWSWLFADLHAHVIVMPVSMLTLALVVLMYVWRCESEAIGATRIAAAWLLLALALGTQAATNSWDFLASAGVLAVMLIASAPHMRVPVTDTLAPLPAAPPRRQRGAVAFELGAIVAVVLSWPAVQALHPYWLGLLTRADVLVIGVLMFVLSRRHPVVVSVVGRAVLALWQLARGAVVPLSAILLVSVLFFLVFYRHLDARALAVRINHDGHISVEQAIRHFGVFVLWTIAWIATVVSAIMTDRQANAAATRRWTAIAVIELLLVGLLMSVPLLRAAGGLSLYLLMLPPLIGTAMTTIRAEARVSTLLLACGWGIAAASELFVLTDRMNTVFKLYHPAWMLLAIGSGGVVAALSCRARPPWTTRTVVAGVALLFVLAGVGTVRNIVGVLTRNLQVSATPTLNGLDFLNHSPDGRELLDTVRWLHEQSTDVVVVAEAFTDRAYDDSARITKYTGLPTVLGWAHHVRQRGRDASQIRQRQRDLERLYSTTSDQEFFTLVRKYDIRYIVVGDLEREQYGRPESSLARITGVTEVFHSATRRYVVFAP